MNKLQLKKHDPDLYNEILKWPGKKFNESNITTTIILQKYQNVLYVEKR